MDSISKYRIVADVISLCDENDRLRQAAARAVRRKAGRGN